MSHNSVLFCNINRVEDLNKRISRRNIPDNAMKPNCSFEEFLDAEIFLAGYRTGAVRDFGFRVGRVEEDQQPNE